VVLAHLASKHRAKRFDGVDYTVLRVAVPELLLRVFLSTQQVAHSGHGRCVGDGDVKATSLAHRRIVMAKKPLRPTPWPPRLFVRCQNRSWFGSDRRSRPQQTYQWHIFCNFVSGTRALRTLMKRV